jgi:copper chaperone CopZ
MNTILCSVSGIQNKECKTQIKNALNKIQGVQDVGVNLTTGTVEIQYNDPATDIELKKCIENTGFEIVYQ